MLPLDLSISAMCCVAITQYTHSLHSRSSIVKSPPFDSATTSFVHGACAFRKSSQRVLHVSSRTHTQAKCARRVAAARRRGVCARQHKLAQFLLRACVRDAFAKKKKKEESSSFRAFSLLNQLKTGVRSTTSAPFTQGVNFDSCFITRLHFFFRTMTFNSKTISLLI